jgi:hypothetical protein
MQRSERPSAAGGKLTRSPFCIGIGLLIRFFIFII